MCDRCHGDADTLGSLARCPACADDLQEVPDSDWIEEEVADAEHDRFTVMVRFDEHEHWLATHHDTFEVRHMSPKCLLCGLQGQVCRGWRHCYVCGVHFCDECLTAQTSRAPRLFSKRAYHVLFQDQPTHNDWHRALGVEGMDFFLSDE